MNAIRCRINRLKEKTDLPKDVCSYLLRHAFGTNAILNGVDVVTVAQLMGHESLDMIKKVYAHLADKHEHLQDAMEQARRRPAPAKPPQGEKRRQIFAEDAMTAMVRLRHNMSVNIIFKRMGIVRKTKEIIEAISHGGQVEKEF